MTQTEIKKTKEKKAPDPEKQFIETMKLYFASITSRCAQYAYFNLDDNLVLLCNSTSGTPNDIHGDRITEYAVGELTFHFVYFKDTKFFQEVRTFLQVPDGVIYCVQILNVLALLSKTNKRSKISFFHNEVGDQVGVVKGLKTWTKKNITGYVVKDFHIISELVHWCRTAREIGSASHRDAYPHFDADLDPDTPLSGRVFLLPVESSSFRQKDGSPVFTHVQPEMKILGLDGLTSVSLREFVKRIRKQPFTLRLYMWSVDASYVLHMTQFENDMVAVRTYRPNVHATPIPDTIVMSDIVTQPFSGETDE